jgi:uncharacterized protein
MVDLFPRHEIIGVFRGFHEGGLEFHADLTIPYRAKLHNVPMHGQFVLVQLEHPDEAVLGRITSLSAEGRLTSAAGEQYSIRAVGEGRQVPDHLREEYLRYRVNIRVLGVVRLNGEDGITFVPSQRRLPHVGSPIAFPSDEILCHLVGHNGEGAELGFFALGEYIYAYGDTRLETAPWMQLKEPLATVKFSISNLVSRRTFVFARAGFGKSNLNKLLFSRLYLETPTVRKRSGREVPVGTVIFDPDGEYFWPDDKGRPGLSDVKELEDQIVVFTSRTAPSLFYDSFVAGGVKLDIRRLQPSDVISIALSPEKQDQQNVRKLRGMNLTNWSELVDLIYRHGNSADLNRIQELLHLEIGQDVEALAARANMTSIVRMLHDPSSQLMDMLLEALTEGKLCVVDVSQLRGGPSLILSGLILRRIFDRNQEEFTKAEPRTIPTIAVVEEAQAVLNEKSSASAPYIEWVKEGRKYDLGALLITQQPGSIPTEILSQGDNWFVFHLLSEADLRNVKSANAHFSNDLLSALLNEPIPGQGVFWSSAGNTIYPIPLRALLFERLYQRRDTDYRLPAVDVYANRLRQRYRCALKTEVAEVFVHGDSEIKIESKGEGIDEGGEVLDVFSIQKQRAIKALERNQTFKASMQESGIPWGVAKALIAKELPSTMDDRDTVAYHLVKEAMDQIFGEGNWATERRGAKSTTFIIKK